MPAAVDKLAAQRVGNDVYLTLTVPSQNIDASTPADVSRIDVFGVTASAPPPRARIFEIASRVATVDVQPVVATAPEGAPPGGDATPALPTQGATVTIRDRLTPEDLIPKELPPSPGGTQATAPVAATSAPAVPRRYYIAVATSDRGRSGPPGLLIDLPLVALPDPPGALQSTYDEDGVTVSWEPAGGVVGFLLQSARPLDPPPGLAPINAPPPTSQTAAASPPLYNVYREPSEDQAGAAPAVVGVSPPAPLNAAPLAALSFVDPVPVEFGRPRCYSVRTVRGTGPTAVISVPSERHCLIPEDIFPPAAPTGLSSIAGEGAITLLWEPNGEADLGGYLVLRGRPGDATLQPLTPVPVMDVRYEDHAVMPGVRYVYAIRAVDTHQPTANVSDESNRVEDTAR